MLNADYGTPWLRGERTLHVLDALLRDGDRVWFVVEHLHRHPSFVPAVAQGLEDRDEVDVAEPWSAQVDVVGVKVSGGPPVAANQVGDRRGFAAHGLDVEVQS